MRRLYRHLLVALFALVFTLGGIARPGSALPIAAATPTPAAAKNDGPPPEPLEYPDSEMGVNVEVIEDNRVEHLNNPAIPWSQTVRVSILSGGTLADASDAVYGNNRHVDELFNAARELDPELTNPALVQIGQQMVLKIAPERRFILKKVDNNGKRIVREYTNGAVEIIPLPVDKPTGSLKRRVELPDDPKIAFLIPGEAGPVETPPGGRLTELVYHEGQSFEDLSREALGESASLEVTLELARQTGWTPTKWPPKTGEAKTVVLESYSTYKPDSSGAVELIPPAPDARADFERLIAQRTAAGIYPVERSQSGILYRVSIRNPKLTARDVSKLVYGDDLEAQNISRLAGFEPLDRDGFTFNPRLFGTRFELRVDYIRERFVYKTSLEGDMASGKEMRVERLLNGAIIETSTNLAEKPNGLWQRIIYPTGYQRLVLRPATALLTVSDAYSYLRGLDDLPSEPSRGRLLDRLRLNAEYDHAKRLRAEYAGEFAWTWSIDKPEDGVGGAPEEFFLAPAEEVEGIDLAALPKTDRAKTRLLVVSLAPTGEPLPAERLFNRVFRGGPIISIALIFGGGTFFALLVGVLSRSRIFRERG